MKTNRGGWIGLAVVVGLLASGAFGAGTNYVASGTSHTPPFDTWATAATNIQTAVDYASANIGTYDTVMVSNGVYSVTNSIALTNGVKVVSLSGRDLTIVDGGGSGGIGTAKDAIFVLNHAGTVVDGFTISNGWSRGVRFAAGGTLRNCTIVKSKSSGSSIPVSSLGGGGFYMAAGLMSNCLVTANGSSSYAGGGGALDAGDIVDCVISNNSDTYCSGFYCGSGGTLTRCRIVNNNSGDFGGGGGGNGKPTLRNCLVAYNVSGGAGGGIRNGLLYNCTVVSNRATGAGGGVNNCTLTNCIVYGNSAGSFPNISGGSAAYTCATPKPVGTGNIDSDPLFANFSGGDFHIGFGSKAIDSATTIAAVTDDFERTPRPQNGNGLTNAYDMGCYEVAASTTGVLRCLLTVAPVIGLESLTATCTAVIAGAPAVTNIQYYWWDFGDGQSTNGTSLGQVAHLFGPGRFSVSLIVSNDLGSVTNWTEAAVVQVASAASYVSESGTGSFPYASWDTAASNIQDAVDAAQTAYGAGALNSRVWVSNGTYTVVNSPVTITTGIRVQSVAGSAVTKVVRGSGTISLFSIQHANAIVDGFTITNGNNRGVHMTDGTIQNCTIVKNTESASGGGGGIYMAAGLMSNCVVAANTGSYAGGGVRIGNGAMVDCVVSNNSGPYCGGVWVSGSPVLTRCRIVKNSATGGYGGGVAVIAGGVPTLRNCLVAYNTTTTYGGGVQGATLENCTVVSNTAATTGGGTYGCTLKNCIVYFNSNPNESSDSATYTCSTPKPIGTGNIGDDPLFANFAAGDFHLRFGSKAIDAGTNIALVPDDLERTLRPQNGNGLTNAYDMGCYEAAASTAGVLRCLLTVAPASGLESLTATCTAVIAGAPAVTNVVYYWWNFGDGQTDEGGAGHGQVAHVFGPGRFSITLSVSNDQGSVTSWVENAAVQVASATAYVTQGGTGSFPYVSWAMAASNIQDAVDAAQTAYGAGALNARVWVSNGTYMVGAPVTITAGIRVQSVGGRDKTVVARGSGTISVFGVYHGNAVVDGFTISNGNCRGVYMTTGTVQNCAIVNNNNSGVGLAQGGGGFYLTGGLLSNCLVAANSGSGYVGGAGAIFNGVMADCVVSNNTDGLGGGIYVVSGGIATFNRCRILKNSATGGHGGGLWTYGALTLRNCLIAYNTATGTGGAAYNGSSITMENCTVVSNTAATGGAMNGGTLKNCIVYFNAATTDPNMNGGSATYTCTTNPVMAGASNKSGDPLFVNLAAGIFRLQDASPCVDAGQTNGLTWLNAASLDLNGNRRVVNLGIDMGAYETVPPPGTLILVR